jgi:hypothetical protein
MNYSDTKGAVCCQCLLRVRKRLGSFNAFLRTPWYILIAASLTALSSLFQLDLPFYTLLLCFGLYVSLFGEDFLPLVPLVLLGYISPSRENNPGRYPDSIFYPQNGGIFLIVLGGLFVASIVFRLVTDKELGGKNFLREKRSLSGSMIILGLSYLISGIGLEQYPQLAGKNLTFAVLQFAAVFGMYFFFCGSVKWKRVPKGYLAWSCVAAGWVVLLQLLENYLSGRIFVGSSMDRELIATGWGMHNNIGCMMAIMMPFGFYLASVHKKGWLFHLLGSGLLLGTMLSCSRTSMFVAMLAYLLCAVLLLRNPQSRRTNLWVYIGSVAAAAVLLILLADKIWSVFERFISQMGNISQRDNLSHYGIRQFLEEPLFGGSFYPQGKYVPWDWSNLDSFSSFFPPRWHSTIVQILASCGAVGISAYGLHRFKTLQLFWKQRSREKTYIAISIGALLMASLLDCHFFNVGPVLYYSMALAFVEKMPGKQNNQEYQE